MRSNSVQIRCFLVVLILTTGIMSGCSTAPLHHSSEIHSLTDQVIPTFDFDDLSTVSADMEEFLDLHLPATMNRRQRTWKLALVTSDQYILQFTYDSSMTLSPAETFASLRGNCLSFSLMLMAMARHAGIPARLQEVVLPPEYRAENGTFINSRHINVKLGDKAESFTVDVSGKDISNSIRTRHITRSEAEAQYYNNLGVEELLSNNLPAAWARFRQAIEVDPGLGYIWSNLGVVYNRNGQVKDAEWAYEIALSSNDDDSSALNNLYVIFQQEGRWLEAARLEQQVERHRRRNPYYLAMLADEAVRSRQYNDAIALLKRSIRINGEEYRFYGALAQAHYLAGNHKQALNSLDTARSLAPAAEVDSLKLSFTED